MEYLLQGFMLGLAYVAPIGMQNMYVINTAASTNKVRALQVALITVFFDVSLALACFFGVGLLLEQVPALRGGFLLLGSAAVIYIGMQLLRSKPMLDASLAVNQPLRKVVGVCFAVTWLNPQAIIDGSLLLGGFRASLPPAASTLFILGVAAASLSWFTCLATVVSLFGSRLTPKLTRTVNIACGAIIIFFGLRLGYSFFNL